MQFFFDRIYMMNTIYLGRYLPMRNSYRIFYLVCALAVAMTCSAEPADLTNSFFAMDTGTKNARYDTPEKQTAMLKELGYAGSDFTGTRGIPDYLKALDAHGLKLFGIYTGASIDPEARPVSTGLKRAIKQLKGREAVLWMPLGSKKYDISSPEGDADAVKVLREIADLAAESNLRIALYPHTDNWIERVEDAVRVVKQVGRTNVGVTFNLCHWLRVDGKDLRATLEAALPHLFVVTINGADADGQDWGKLIQPLDCGTFDVATLLGILKELGYTGPIGLQGYGIGGDVHKNLKRSMAAWRTLTEKLTE